MNVDMNVDMKITLWLFYIAMEIDTCINVYMIFDGLPINNGGLHSYV
jgi:hypothetical protein